jgi:hypothetical protein
MRRFRDDRLAKLIARETPVPIISDCAYAMVHLLPLCAFADAVAIDTTAVSQKELPPIYHGFEHSECRRLNIDGVVTYCGADADRHSGYTQLFRNGAIEVVEFVAAPPDSRPGAARIIGSGYEVLLIKAMGDYLRLLKELDVAVPVFVLSAMCGVKGCIMPVGVFSNAAQYPIDRDDLLLPEAVVDEYAVQPELIMKPVFDAAWNAVGQRGSANYKNGVWSPSR